MAAIARWRSAGPPAPGHAVRRAGDDARAGDVLLTAGTVLGPAQIGLVAAAGARNGAGAPAAARRGDLDRQRAGRAGSTAHAREDLGIQQLHAGRRGAAGRLPWPSGSPVVPDDPHRLLETIEDQLLRADLLVTSGGVSMGGANDVVKDVLRPLGTVTFRKVAMQPGMPQGFGVVGPDATPIYHAARQPGQRLRVVPGVRPGCARRAAAHP